MERITILNSCHHFPGFVYQQARFSADRKSIEVAVRPRKGSAAVCSLVGSTAIFGFMSAVGAGGDCRSPAVRRVTWIAGP